MPKVTPGALPAKTRTTPITLELLTNAAFEIVDVEGAAGLSARKLASRLGCEAMSLYHHVANMDAVLDHVVGQLLAQCTPIAGDSSQWQQQLTRACDDYLSMALRHPRVFALAAGRRWVSVSAYQLAGSLVSMFQAAGLPAHRAASAARALGAYLNGAGMALSGWQLRQTAPDTGPSHTLSEAELILRQQFDSASLRRDLDAGMQVLIEGLLAQQRC